MKRRYSYRRLWPGYLTGIWRRTPGVIRTLGVRDRRDGKVYGWRWMVTG